LRIKIKLSCQKQPLRLPRHYNYIVQSFIYRNLNKKLAEKIHKKGEILGKRHFKLFTFSRIFGKFKNEKETLVFHKDINFLIASPITEILESFATTLVKKGEIKLNGCTLFLSGIEVLYSPEIKENILVRTLSPITVYSTLQTPEGKKKTYYYSPFENDFSNLVKQNLIKKYTIIHKQNSKKMDFAILPEKVSSKNQHVIFYKGTVIKAWSGVYRLKGAKELIGVAYDTGLGSKNSQGFGMIEVLE